MELSWGNGAIIEREWNAIEAFIKEKNIKSVIEYGYGISTVKFNAILKNVTTYESMINYLNDGLRKNYNLRLWNTKGMVPLKRVDMVFIDGPCGDRCWSFKNAVLQSDLIVIHDAGRERKLREKYMSDYKVIKSKDRLVFCQRKGIDE